MSALAEPTTTTGGGWDEGFRAERRTGRFWVVGLLNRRDLIGLKVVGEVVRGFRFG